MYESAEMEAILNDGRKFYPIYRGHDVRGVFRDYQWVLPISAI